MSFLSSANALSITKSFTGLSLGPMTQVRTATKKVAGSKTSMKDSAGRRLGAKAAENEPVKTGQILMRQRGTRFYPGENAAIGKDHTIFAAEPGYVRFYLDPFHPERKFIGVALRPELRLPTPHFEPSIRRLGYVPIEDQKKADFEENNLSRKDHLQRPQILNELKERQRKREATVTQYTAQLKSLLPELSPKELDLVAERLLLIRNHLKSGLTLEVSQATTASIHLQNLKLQHKRGLISTEGLEQQKTEYLSLAKKCDSSVSFDNKFQLTKYLSTEGRNALLSDLEQQLQSIIDAQDKDVVAQLKKTLEKSTLILALEKKVLYGKFVKPLQSSLESLAKANINKKWNYERKRVESLSQ